MTGVAAASRPESRSFTPRPGLIGLLIAGLVVATWMGPDALFTAASIAILLLVSRDRLEQATAVFLPIAARAMLALGLFRFESPDQVVDLAARAVSPIVLVMQNDIWWPRYLLTYPAVWGMDLWGMRFDQTFALYSAAILPITVFTLYRAARDMISIEPDHRSRSDLVMIGILAVLVFGLGTKMNGRLIFAHLGMAVLLTTQTVAVGRRRLTRSTWALTALGLVMGQMSSGTGAVAAGQALVGTLVVGWRAGNLRGSLPGLALMFAIAGPFLYRSEIKNVIYFGGGFDAIPGLLHHGAAGYLLDRPPLLALAVTIAVALVGATIVQLRGGRLRGVRPEWSPALVSLPLAAAGGMFGFSTLTMVLPGIFLLVTAAGVTVVDRSGWLSAARAVPR